MAQRKREVKQLVEAEGLEVLGKVENTGSGHLSVRARRSDGVEQRFIFALTPSDRRECLNARAHVRRFARGTQS